MDLEEKLGSTTGVVAGHRAPAGLSVAIRHAATKIIATRWQREAGAIRALWLAGDAVRSLRSRVPPGSWRTSLKSLAAQVQIHPKRLDDAERVSSVFREESRETLLRKFETAAGLVTASHLVELARAAPSHRARGLQALAKSPLTVRQLRSYLRAGRDLQAILGPEGPAARIGSIGDAP